ncbi:MAG: hypothetical protein WKG00_03330 [Polyangiaceae bacterium]
MPGFGDSPFGVAPFGGELPPAPGEPLPPMPRAARFDGLTRSFDPDTDTHPVTQEVALAFFVEAGKLQSAPDVGNTVRRMTHIEADKLQVEVDRRIRAAMKRPLDAGAIRILELTAVTLVTGRISIRFRFQNLLDPESGDHTLST